MLISAEIAESDLNFRNCPQYRGPIFTYSMYIKKLFFHTHFHWIISLPFPYNLTKKKFINYIARLHILMILINLILLYLLIYLKFLLHPNFNLELIT